MPSVIVSTKPANADVSGSTISCSVPSSGFSSGVTTPVSGVSGVFDCPHLYTLLIIKSFDLYILDVAFYDKVPVLYLLNYVSYYSYFNFSLHLLPLQSI